jgi:hypothetical protein
VDQPSREARLKADHESLQALDAASSIFSMEVTGEPPDRYTLTFRGKGIGRDASSQSEVTSIELHQIDLRMPYSYPNSPPDIRWITPILHNRFVQRLCEPARRGIVWTKDVPIDMLCERLWDVARAEFLNLNKATNYSAKNWFEKECQQPLPADHRPLRDQAAAASGTNIVRYERRGAGQGVQFAGAAAAGDVMFIDETTPTPQMPQRQPYVPVGRRGKRSGGEDVIYIGPEGQ